MLSAPTTQEKANQSRRTNPRGVITKTIKSGNDLHCSLRARND
jgi:hypothetical protein